MLALDGLLDLDNVFKDLMKLSIPINKELKVHYHDALAALATKAYGLTTAEAFFLSKLQNGRLANFSSPPNYYCIHHYLGVQR